VESFDGERVIVVERYDRLVRDDGTVSRIHQEDLCQALGLPPTTKYQNEGGPSPEQVISLLRSETRPVSSAEADCWAFVDALAFNWIIAGTDAHAKNYSVLIADRQVRLAPIYDVSSALPYDDMNLTKLKVAMCIGGEYQLERIGRRHWHRFSIENGFEPARVIERVRELAARVPAGVVRAADSPAVRALNSELPARLAERVAGRASRCEEALAEPLA
jgi:serine/threonine-protein kinase HipA